jgi:hypothetical protein
MGFFEEWGVVGSDVLFGVRVSQVMRFAGFFVFG